MSEKKINIYVSAICISKPGTMGGNTRIFLECAKQWVLNPTVNLTVITGDDGYQTCRDYNLSNVNYYKMQTKRLENVYGELLSHFPITLAVKDIINSIPSSEGVNLVYAASDALPDIITASYLKAHLGAPFFGSLYLLLPNPLKGFKHSYDGLISFPNLKWTVYFFYQRILIKILKKNADHIFITNDHDKKIMKKLGFNSMKAVYGGVQIDQAARFRNSSSNYEGCFIGRIHPQKGLKELIEIWSLVNKKLPGAKLIIIGNGEKKYTDKLKKIVHKKGLDKQIKWLGFVDGFNKYRIVKSCKVFLHTTIYDNNGMAACEGMAAKLPAVCFDIPALKIAYPQGMLKAEIGNYQDFANKVIRLLTEEDLYKKVSSEAFKHAQKFDWQLKAKEMLSFMEANS